MLLVEDDRELARLIRRGLEEDGYEVLVAYSVANGYQHVVANDLDTAIIDVTLGDGNGIELARRIRAGGYAIPILILTARSEVSSRVEGLDAGADDYVIKPISIEELGARMRALRRRYRGDDGAVIRLGNLVFSPDTLTVSRDDTEIDLTPTEARLLETLMQHAGQVLRRDQLADHVWPDRLGPSSNSIDVHIKAIRQKIDTPFDTDSIETVRGMGYRMRRQPRNR